MIVLYPNHNFVALFKWLMFDPTSQGALIFNKALYKKARSHQNLNGEGTVLLQDQSTPQQLVIFKYSTTLTPIGSQMYQLMVPLKQNH